MLWYLHAAMIDSSPSSFRRSWIYMQGRRSTMIVAPWRSWIVAPWRSWICAVSVWGTAAIISFEWGRQCFVMAKRLIIKDARQVQGNHTEIIIRLASQTRVPLTPPHTHTNWTNAAAAAASNEKACSKGKGDQGRRAPKQRREIKGVKSS